MHKLSMTIIRNSIVHEAEEKKLLRGQIFISLAQSNFQNAHVFSV